MLTNLQTSFKHLLKLYLLFIVVGCSGVIWHMSGALYAADPGSIPDKNNALFSEILILTFKWAYTGWLQSSKWSTYCTSHIVINTNLDISPKSEPALELHSRAAPSVEAHHRLVGPDRKKFRRKVDKKRWYGVCWCKGGNGRSLSWSACSRRM